MNLPNIPPEMRSTVSMLRSAYPHGIPKDEMAPLVAVLEDGGMSQRSMATAMALSGGGDFFDYIGDVRYFSGISSHRVTDNEVKERIRERLKPHGYEEWLQES